MLLCVCNMKVQKRHSASIGPLLILSDPTPMICRIELANISSWWDQYEHGSISRALGSLLLKLESVM